MLSRENVLQAHDTESNASNSSRQHRMVPFSSKKFGRDHCMQKEYHAKSSSHGIDGEQVLPICPFGLLLRPEHQAVCSKTLSVIDVLLDRHSSTKDVSGIRCPRMDCNQCVVMNDGRNGDLLQKLEDRPGRATSYGTQREGKNRSRDGSDEFQV